MFRRIQCRRQYARPASDEEWKGIEQANSAWMRIERTAADALFRPTVDILADLDAPFSGTSVDLPERVRQFSAKTTFAKETDSTSPSSGSPDSGPLNRLLRPPLCAGTRCAAAAGHARR